MEDIVETTDIQYDDLMGKAVTAHSLGDHESALSLREEAFWSTDDPVQQARALRDASASHGYLGQHKQQEAAARGSLRLLEEHSAPLREVGA